MDVHIYKLSDPITHNIRYVGLTRHPQHRLRQHRHYGGPNKHLKRWVAKLKRLGYAPRMEILETVPEKLADMCERKWISACREFGAPLLNATDGGEVSYSPNEHVRRQLSLKSKGRGLGVKQRPETTEKIRKALAGRRLNPHPSYFITLNKARTGIPLSEEHKRKCGDALRGRKFSDEHRAKMSRNAKARWQDPEYRKRVLGTSNNVAT